MSEDKIKATGVVIKVLPNTQFKVDLDDMDNTITAYLSGKMRQHGIKVLRGDKVTVEISPYDLNKGRIIYRGDKNE